MIVEITVSLQQYQMMDTHILHLQGVEFPFVNVYTNLVQKSSFNFKWGIIQLSTFQIINKLTAASIK